MNRIPTYLLIIISSTYLPIIPIANTVSLYLALLLLLEYNYTFFCTWNLDSQSQSPSHSSTSQIGLRNVGMPLGYVWVASCT